MVPTKNRHSWGFSFRKLICHVLILNHIWVSCAQATRSISDFSDETAAEERAWNHLAKIRVQITPENFLDSREGLRLKAYKTDFAEHLKEQEDSGKGTILENQELANLPLNYKSLNDIVPEACTSHGITCNLGGLNLFIGWNGKIWVNGGEADSVSLETPQSIIFAHPVKAKGLTLRASHCEIQSSLDIEDELEIGMVNPHKGLVIKQKRDGRQGVLSVQNMRVHEGLIHIDRGGRMILKENALLDLNHEALLNEGLLAALGDSSIHHVGLLHNKFHLFSPQGHLSLEGGELRNEGSRLEAHNLSLEFQEIGNHPIHRDHQDTASVIMATETLTLKGNGSSLNKGTIQGKKVLIQNKDFTNEHLLQAEEELHLAPQKNFTNEQKGWVKALGTGLVSGSGKVLNLGGRVALDDSLGEEHRPPEGAGMTFQNLLFDHFTGTLMNEGSWMTQEQVTGDIKTFLNQGTWKSAHTSLAIQQFETLLGATLQDSKIVGDGQWTIKTGVNRSLMQGEDLEIIVQEDFDQKGVLQANQRLGFQGENIQNEGRIETQNLVWQGRQLVNLPAGNIDVKGKADLTLDKLDNGGSLDFKDTVSAQVQKTKNRRGATLSFASDSLYTGKTFKKYGTLKGEGFLNLIMEEKTDLHETTEMDRDLFLKANPLNTSPESKTISKRKLSMEVSDEKGALQPLILKGKTEGKDQFKIKALNLHNTGDMISPGDTPLYTPEGFKNDKKAHLRHLDLTLNYGKTLHNTSTGEMILSSPVRLGQGGLFNNEGTARIGKLDSSLIIPGKMIQDTACEFMTNYPDWSGYLFQHMSNSGNLRLEGGDWRIRGTLYNAPKGILIPEAGTQLLYNGFGNDGKIVAPHGLDISSVNPKNPLRLKGEWQSEGLLTIHHPELEVLGTVRALEGSHIQSNRMTLDDHSVWQDEGTSTLWDIREKFTLEKDANMVMKDWHLKTREGFHYGGLNINGKALLESALFRHQGKTKGKGNLRAVMVKEFDQVGTLDLGGNIALDAPILFDYPSSFTKAGKELSLKTSHPLTGYWEGTQHFAWEGKDSEFYPSSFLRSSGKLVSPTRTTFNAPRDVYHEGNAVLHGLHLYLSPGSTLTNTQKGTLELHNPVSLGYDFNILNQGSLKIGKSAGGKVSEILYHPQAHVSREWQKWYTGKSPWHLLRNIRNDGEMLLAGETWQMTGTLLNTRQGHLQLGGNDKLTLNAIDNSGIIHGQHALTLKSFAPDGNLTLKGQWSSQEKMTISTNKVLTTDTLISPQETSIYSSWGWVSQGKAELSRLSLLISPGSTLLNTGDMKLNQPVSLGYDFNIQNKGIFKAGNLSSPSSALSYMVFNPKETFYGKDSLDWVNGKGAWHLVRNIHNQGELFLADSGKYWKVSGDLLNAPAKIWEVGGGLRLRSKAVPKNQGILKFLTDGEVEAHIPLAFTGEWQGLKALTFWAPTLDNRIAKVRSKGLLTLKATLDDILAGQAQQVMRPVRDLKPEGYQHIPYWEQHGHTVIKNKVRPKVYPYTLTGAGSLTDGECKYPHLTGNGALFQSDTGINAFANGKILNHFGLWYSNGLIHFNPNQLLDNYSGIIQGGSIYIDTPFLDHHLSDDFVDRISDYGVSFAGDEGKGGYIRWRHPASDPALMIATKGDITLNIKGGRIHGSSIVGAKDIFFKQGNQTFPTLPTFRATSANEFHKQLVMERGKNRYKSTYTAWMGVYPAIIQSRNALQVAMPGIQWFQEGRMNASMMDLHMNNFELDPHMERIGIQARAVPDTQVRPFKETLIINLGEMFPPSMVKALKDGESLSPDVHSIPKDDIVLVKRSGERNTLRNLLPYLSSELLQGSLMQALSSIAGTLKITQELSLEAQMRALHRQAKERSGGSQEIVLKDKDLKELKKSFIGYVEKKIGDVQTLVAHLYLSPQDVNLRGLKLGSLTADGVKAKTEENMMIRGSVYGRDLIDLEGWDITIERPEIRFQQVIEETTTSGSIYKTSNTTNRLVETVLAGHGGDFETSLTGRTKMLAHHDVKFKGVQMTGGTLDVKAENALKDETFKTVEHVHYDVSKKGDFGGAVRIEGYVQQEGLLPSSFVYDTSIKMSSVNQMTLQASQMTAQKEKILLTSDKGFSFIPATAMVESRPELSIEGTQILETVKREEHAKLAQLNAPQVIIDASNGTISGVRPTILSKDPQIRAREIDLMEEKAFRKTLIKDQQTFVVGSTVDPGVKMVMDAALTVACPGLGIVGSHFLSSMIFNKGNLGDALREATSKDALKGLATKLISAEIIKGLDLKAPVGGDFIKHVSYQMQKSLIETGTKAVIYQDKLDEALKDALTQGLINSISSYGAQQIGKAFDPGKGAGEYLTHKAVHGLLGAATGYAIQGKEGALSGAMGAVVAEVVAEMMIDRKEVKLGVEKQALKEGWSQDKERINEEFRDRLQPTLDKTKLVAGMLALAAGRKVDIALQTAATALEYNFLNYAAGYISEREMELIQENSEFDPSWGMERVGYEMAMDPRQAQETLEMAHLMATLHPFYGGAFGLYDAGAGYLSGEYSGKMAIAMAGMEFMPNKKAQKVEKITHKVANKFKNIGNGLSESVKQVEKRTIHNNPLAKNNIGKAKLEQKIQTVHPLKKGVDNPSDTIRGLDLAESKSLQNNPFMGKVGANKAPIFNKVADFKWVIKEAKHADKVGRHPKFGNIYKDPNQKAGNKAIFWSKDVGGNNAHSGKHYKLFEERAEYYDWIADVDPSGKVIPKHKSDVGKRIFKKDLIKK